MRTLDRWTRRLDERYADSAPMQALYSMGNWLDRLPSGGYDPQVPNVVPQRVRDKGWAESEAIPAQQESKDTAPPDELDRRHLDDLGVGQPWSGGVRLRFVRFARTLGSVTLAVVARNYRRGSSGCGPGLPQLAEVALPPRSPHLARLGDRGRQRQLTQAKITASRFVDSP